MGTICFVSAYPPPTPTHTSTTALLGTSGSKLWSGLILDPEHGWKWSNGRPYNYMRWDSGRYFFHFHSIFFNSDIKV